MIEYLIKSTICSFILYLSYILLLKKSRNYKLNRLILLFSVLFFLSIPLVRFSTNNLKSQQIISNDILQTPASIISSITNDADLNNTVSLDGNLNYMNYLIIAYVLITTILLRKYIRNFYILVKKNKTLIKSDYNGHKITLIDQKVNPFSFFNAIYVSKENFQMGNIDCDLILHEIAHKKQFHSIDIVIIELIQALLWINPFIFLFKKLIKTNHEFLADEFVVKSGTSNHEYSNKILQYSFRNKTLNLASGFNYSLIKNRLIMLSKYKQKKPFAYQIVLFLPIVVFIYITMAFTETNDVLQNIFNQNPTEKCVIEYYNDNGNNRRIINGNKDELYNLMNDKYFISNEPISGTFSNQNNKTEIILSNYKFNEKNGQIYIDNKKVGSVQKDDIIILHREKRIDVYSKNRVKIIDKPELQSRTSLKL